MASVRTRPAPPALAEGGERELVVALVNNMPDAALRTTEWQVRGLLSRAAGEHGLRLRLFSLPQVPRSQAGKDHVAQFHEPIEALFASRDIGGLIVTGTEPKAPVLTDEPYWPALVGLVDWAAENTVSTIWSCLASHAAVFHLDRIARRSLPSKAFGVFDCDRIGDHPLVRGIAHWRVPHSRQNDLPEAPLLDAGYRVLSRSPDVGVDIFIKEVGSVFVFLQGHPEYDAMSLFGEYRRDIRRFLSGVIDCYPELPHGYFGQAAAEILSRFREAAMEKRDIALLENLPVAAVAPGLRAPWRDAATQIYANWLGMLRERACDNRLGERVAPQKRAGATERYQTAVLDA